MMESLAARIQHLLPQHTLTALVYRLMRCRNRWIKNSLIKIIGTLAGINVDEAKSPDPDDHACFNDFFTRELKEGARPLDAGDLSLLSPCDGRISEAGVLHGDRILQAKGKDYRLQALLADDPSCETLTGGTFFTIYLSPRDYHRVHMPVQGKLLRMIHVPGKLFSVAPYTVRQIPDLFARNERVVCIFDTAWGPLAQVLVGAMLVGSMETVWAGEVTPSKRKSISRWSYDDENIVLERGQEMGRFNMGSTVIMAMPPGMLSGDTAWPVSGRSVLMGQNLALMNPGSKMRSKPLSGTGADT